MRNEKNEELIDKTPTVSPGDERRKQIIHSV